MEPILVPGRNCWRIEHCERASVIIDAAAYYRHIRKAMAAAKQRILIIGWDFDTRILLEPTVRQDETLGPFFLDLAKKDPARRIDILKWSFGAKKQFLHPAAAWMLWRWALTKAIEFRFDAAHPPGCSHHQKIVVLDDKLAVCGGIDIATARWDTPDHDDDNPYRRLPDGKSYPPWHDVTMMLTGKVASALGQLGIDRWLQATSRKLEPIPENGQRLWPDDLKVHFENVDIGIARTRAKYQDLPEIREIEALYLDMVCSAQRFVYIENQYFTSAKIAGAIAKRLEEPDPPEFVLVMPRSADGWLEQMAMDAARIRLVRQIAKKDIRKRFRIFVPVTEKGTDIYVHAKVAIVDDRLLHIGSSNLNNRSLGLDSECDVIIDAALGSSQHVSRTIAHLRNTLLAEHLGSEPDTVAETLTECGSLLATIEKLRGQGRTLEELDLVAPGPLEEYLAENEVLDPENADAFLEPMSQRGLKKHWFQGLSWMRRSMKRSPKGPA